MCSLRKTFIGIIFVFTLFLPFSGYPSVSNDPSLSKNFEQEKIIKYSKDHVSIYVLELPWRKNEIEKLYFTIEPINKDSFKRFGETVEILILDGKDLATFSRTELKKLNAIKKNIEPNTEEEEKLKEKLKYYTKLENIGEAIQSAANSLKRFMSYHKYNKVYLASISTEKPVFNEKKKIYEYWPSMMMSISTDPEVSFVTHMGIVKDTHNLMVKNKLRSDDLEKQPKGVSTLLHGFAAKFILEVLNPEIRQKNKPLIEKNIEFQKKTNDPTYNLHKLEKEKVYMWTRPLSVMSGIILKGLKKVGAVEGKGYIINPYNKVVADAPSSLIYYGGSMVKTYGPNGKILDEHPNGMEKFKWLNDMKEHRGLSHFIVRLEDLKKLFRIENQK